MEGIILYGAGGHAKVIIEITEKSGLLINGLLDTDVAHGELLGYPIYRNESNLFDNCHWLISIGNNAVRKRIVSARERKYCTLIHPNAVISTRVQIGEGSVFMAGTVVNSGASIGSHCIINTNASVDHDTILEDFVHLSPNVALAGSVMIGEGTHVGIGACVIQGVRVGKWCTIGAGAVIIRDVPDGATVVGNPGKIIKENMR